MKSKSAFTLVEMAMVLIIMGIIVGSSTKIFASMSKNAKLQETKELLKQISLDIEGFTQAFNRLPSKKELLNFRIESKDSWGKEIAYFTTKALTKNLCGKTQTSLMQKQNDKIVQNVAFFLVSSGANRNMQTSIEKTKVITIHTAARSEHVDFNANKINRIEAYDDLYTTRTLWSVQARLDCNEKGSL